jgi:hypothetical protein
MTDTFLVQIFLSHKPDSPGPGIFEVSIAKDSLTLYCTCPGYIAKSVCKHTKLVQGRMDKNGGIYPYKFDRKFTVEEINAASTDTAKFRELVIQHGKIEVY